MNELTNSAIKPIVLKKRDRFWESISLRVSVMIKDEHDSARHFTISEIKFNYIDFFNLGDAHV